MKTKIRSFFAITVLAFVGILNANASINFDEKNSASGNTNLNISFMNDTELNEAVDYQKEAQLITKWIADMAEAKATQQVIERNTALVCEPAENNEVLIENSFEITDYRKEAQLITKAIADREEANAIQNLVNEGKYSESR